jgi:hypothetical protein
MFPKKNHRVLSLAESLQNARESLGQRFGEDVLDRIIAAGVKAREDMLKRDPHVQLDDERLAAIKDPEEAFILSVVTSISSVPTGRRDLKQLYKEALEPEPELPLSDDFTVDDVIAHVRDATYQAVTGKKQKGGGGRAVS